jgi:putative transposase
LTLQSHLPDYGCRKLAHQFNRLYFASTGISVGKTWVAEALKKHRYELVHRNKHIKHQIPYPIPVNRIWALDTTIVSDCLNQQHTVFGIIDHGSRFVTALRVLQRFNAWTALGHVFLAIGHFGKPRCIRSDNHPVFHSFLWKQVLVWAGIRIQFSRPFSPWENGRIERLFGTFKERLRHFIIHDKHHLTQALPAFLFWYNYTRPHQHLFGQTPAEAWDGIDPYQQPVKSIGMFKGWHGALRGFYLRR